MDKSETSKKMLEHLHKISNGAIRLKQDELSPYDATAIVANLTIATALVEISESLSKISTKLGNK